LIANCEPAHIASGRGAVNLCLRPAPVETSALKMSAAVPSKRWSGCVDGERHAQSRLLEQQRPAGRDRLPGTRGSPAVRADGTAVHLSPGKAVLVEVGAFCSAPRQVPSPLARQPKQWLSARSPASAKGHSPRLAAARLQSSRAMRLASRHYSCALSLRVPHRPGGRPALDETVGVAEQFRHQKSRHTGPRVRPWAGPRINSSRCPWLKWIPACAGKTKMCRNESSTSVKSIVRYRWREQDDDTVLRIFACGRLAR
jgi:hypothetical protein